MRDHRIDDAYEEVDFFYVNYYFCKRGCKVEQTPIYGKIDYNVTIDGKEYLIEAKFRSIRYDNEATKPWYFNAKRLNQMREQKGDRKLLLFYAFPKDGKFVLYDLDKLNLDDEDRQATESVNNPSKGKGEERNLLLQDSDILGVREYDMRHYKSVLHQALIHQGVDNKTIYEELKKWR